MPQCKFCQQEFGMSGLRLGGCWDCATAESIIEDGFDMYEKGPNGSEKPATASSEKLQFLISLGWKMVGRPELTCHVPASRRDETAEGEAKA